MIIMITIMPIKKMISIMIIMITMILIHIGQK